MLRQLLAICDTPGDAEEITAAVFVRVWLHLDARRARPGDLESWLHAIGERCVSDFYRSWKGREGSARRKARRAVSPDFDRIVREEEFPSPELREAVGHALHKLPALEERFLRLRFFEGMTVVEISRSLHLPFHTASRLGRRALEIFREAFLEEGE